MSYQRLLIWVEGPDDERFFNTAVKPTLEDTYDWVEVRPYIQRPGRKVRAILSNPKAMGVDCIFVADINAEPCVTAKKEKIRNTYGDVVRDRILVVIKEIESWYLAGLDHAAGQQLGLRRAPTTTDSLTKEDFDQLIPERFNSRIDFMVEILKVFSMTTAREKNRSFKYFAEKRRLLD